MIFLIRNFYIVITIAPQLAISNLKPLYLIFFHINEILSLLCMVLKTLSDILLC
jgi:hypothetical protein